MTPAETTSLTALLDDNGDASPYQNVAEAAAYLRLSKSKIYKLAETHELRHRKHGGRLIFHRRDLDEYSDRQMVPAIGEAHALDFVPDGRDDVAGSLKTENSRRRGRKPRKSEED